MNRKEFTETSPSVERTYADAVLCTALDIGEGLLKCGAEIQRVEDTIKRIVHAYGAEHVEVFAITSLIIAAIRMPDGEYSSQTRRVYTSANDFRQLEDYNALSRSICRDTPPIDSVQERIREIKQFRKDHRWSSVLGGTLAAAAFAVFFKGNVFDAIAAGLIGFVITLLGGTLFARMSPFPRTFLNSLIAGVLAEAATRCIDGMNADIIMISTIMLLIPGIAFCNSIRDLFCGDTIAGSARLIQAVLLALTIALGFSVAILLFGGVA